MEKKRTGVIENFMIVILAFYPLRHINWGLDLWDTGYNYANFTYMGMEHMDPMWLFSTYLSNAVGNLLTKLPGAGSLFGMNLYTGLFVSALALLSYWFCTRRLHMSVWTAFIGEMIAISLCWCPTALLYNYLTYLLFLGAVIFLYTGLTKERNGYLVAAGLCLGANVLVRFPNLSEAAMIVAVWAYDIIIWLEDRKKPIGGRKEAKENTTEGKTEKGKAAEEDAAEALQHTGFWRRTLSHTGWCLLGYLSALAVLLGYIAIRYGLGEYVTGITRLFAMTDNATDYKATSMVMGVIGTYVENLYWFLRIGIIVVCGMLLFVVSELLESGLMRLKATEDSRKENNRFSTKISVAAGIAGNVIHVTVRILMIAISVAMVVWLYARNFCSFDFYSYDSMLRPGILFLMLTMMIAVIRIFDRNGAKEEKLISGMLILVILLTSLGSNNGVYPSMNNLFVAAPYTLWEIGKFFRQVKEKKIARVTISAFPAKTALAAFLLLCVVQFGGFGIHFVFAEATGVQDANAYVTNNAVLKNIRMSSDKAECMTELSAYAAENNLQGEEVILYGKVPALSYYLQMPSAFNPWSDLDSYSRDTMEQELQNLNEETPVIILGNSYALYEEGGEEALKKWNVSEKEQQAILSDGKWELLASFMEEHGYEQTFRNEKFAVYR